MIKEERRQKRGTGSRAEGDTIVTRSRGGEGEGTGKRTGQVMAPAGHNSMQMVSRDETDVCYTEISLHNVVMHGAAVN